MNEIALMEAASSVYKRKYQCPYCNEKYDRVKLVDHIEKKHSEFIPKDFTASRIVFNIVNKKEKGKCTICGKESPWDEDKCRYDRFCSDKCKKAYEQLAAERLKRVRGMTKQEMLKDPEYQNNIMLANRSISGKYKFQDGTIRTYVGSYEHKFLEFMDKFLNVKSEDLETPGPIIEYKFKGETHKWITDAYYAPYNLAFDIKDGGDNPNKREMPEYRAKQTAKEDAIRKQGKYNYIRLTDNKFEQLIELMLELKELYIENNGEYNPIIRINESTNLLESDSEIEVYRCTYKGEGIYEALRKNIDLETWKSILSSDKINWLPKPPQYKSDKNCRSYFTYKGYKKFSKDVLPIMHKYLDKKYIKIDKLYIYGKPLYQDEYQIVISKELDESAVLESKKVKDLGPKVCSKCGSKNIGVFFQGEPIYKCKDCGEYLGTVPFNESTSNDIIQNAFNSVIHTIKWCRMDDSAFCSINEYSEPKIVNDNSFSVGKFAYESGIDTVVKTINYNNIFENGKYSASCDNNELIITIDKLNNMNESYIIDKIYKGDNNMIHENSTKSNIDKDLENSMKSTINKDFKSKGKLSLSKFKRVTFNKSIIDKYKNTLKILKYAVPKDKGYAWIDKDDNLVAYCTIDDYSDKYNNYIWISALEVAKEYQGYGLSKQLLDVATKELKADALGVSINNKLAKRVYEKYGFKVSKDSEESVKKGKSTMYFMYIGNINEYCVLHDKGYFKLLDKYKDPKDCSWDEEQTYPTIDLCIKSEECYGKDMYCYIMDMDTYSIHYIGKMHISNFEDDGYSVDWLEITDDYPFPRDDINEECKNTEEDWSKSIKEFSIITPSSDKPSQEGFIGHGSWNAIKKVNGEPYRERVEVIIFNKELDKVLIGTRKSDGSVKLPGGGTDKNSSLESQAAKECQEEVKVNIDNLKYIGSYSMSNEQAGYNDGVYKGQYTYLYLATYDSDYTGYIRPEDLDSLYDTAEWMSIYDAKKLLKKRSVDLYNLFNYNYKLYINDLSYLKL